MMVFPSCPACHGALLALRPLLPGQRGLRFSCAECGRSVPPRAWRMWLRERVVRS